MKDRGSVTWFVVILLSFSEHNKHLVEENTPCSVCHDPHGISSIQGNSFNNSHLRKLYNFQDVN